MSGAFTSLLLTPIELVKCKMQVPLETRPGGPAIRPGPLSLIGLIYQHHGIRGFWHGQTGTLIREMGGSAAWFGSYEAISNLFRTTQAVKNAAINLSTTKQNDTNETANTSSINLPIYQQMLAGAVAGMSYNFIFFPADTIKSRMQTEEVGLEGRRRTFLNVGKELWRQHGLKGMYRGCGITCFRSAPSSALIFSIYEGLKQAFP